MLDVLKLVNWMRVKNSRDLQSDDPNVEELTQMKAMKLLYYMQAAFLSIKNKRLFKEDIVAWEYGPVVVSVHDKFRYKRSIATDIDDIAKKDYQDIENNFSDIFLMNSVYNEYGKISTYDLMRQTHREDPWRTTERNAVIDPNKIKNYFDKKGTFKKYQNTNLFAQHLEYDLYEGMKQLNLMDNGSNMVGKENVWSK